LVVESPAESEAGECPEEVDEHGGEGFGHGMSGVGGGGGSGAVSRSRGRCRDLKG